ncbi:response regulator transcription factor [Leptotrichia alba]|uniref:Response regulator transcription factor n=1 Tax=Leptotrichia alba TaxID=3239304 RepID=A0AB39V6B2_9FUSO
MKILLAEDETDLNNVVTRYLKKNGYSVDSVLDGEEALDYLEYGEYDLVILDIMMPKVNGFEVIKKLRDKGNHTPILMLTARDNADDKVKGLDLGADDYIVKPFDFNELMARIRAAVRRKYGNSSNKLVIGNLILNTSEKSVTRDGKRIKLTGKEYEVLEYLMQSKNRILSREQIKEHVWDFDYEGDSNIIDVLIKNIRKKIDVEDGKQIIYTKRGLGYVIKEEN